MKDGGNAATQAKKSFSLNAANTTNFHLAETSQTETTEILGTFCKL
jgi:hypothetical protein